MISDRQTIVGSAKLAKFGNGKLHMTMDYDEAPVKQMEELIRLSQSCNQEFEWDCYFAPLEIRDEKLLTWTDRSGATQSYYFGNGTEDQSICQCATTNECKQAFSINFGKVKNVSFWK